MIDGWTNRRDGNDWWDVRDVFGGKDPEGGGEERPHRNFTEHLTSLPTLHVPTSTRHGQGAFWFHATANDIQKMTECMASM